MKQEDVMERNGWMSSTRAAQLLRRTVYTIYRMVKTGKIEGQRLGGHWYVKVDSMRHWFLKDAKRGGEEKWKYLLREMEAEDSRS